MFYKILHKPTGMWYKPGFESRDFAKNHLSKIGKVYSKRPSWTFVDSGFRREDVENYPQTDFEIVEFEVLERRRISFGEIQR